MDKESFITQTNFRYKWNFRTWAF